MDHLFSAIQATTALKSCKTNGCIRPKPMRRAGLKWIWIIITRTFHGCWANSTTNQLLSIDIYIIYYIIVYIYIFIRIHHPRECWPKNLHHIYIFKTNLVDHKLVMEPGHRSGPRPPKCHRSCTTTWYSWLLLWCWWSCYANKDHKYKCILPVS